jgi:hypothetical protein
VSSSNIESFFRERTCISELVIQSEKTDKFLIMRVTMFRKSIRILILHQRLPDNLVMDYCNVANKL